MMENEDYKLAKIKLDNIRVAWNHYFLEYRFCQGHINYNAETATNYFGDVVAYFDDTFKVISKEPFSNERSEHLGAAMALLQSIYVQQDLMDELMIMFGLPRSGNEHKKTNRDLRNRLIGHPVSRDRKGDLVSTVFLRYDNPVHEIIYVLYEMKDRFKGRMQAESIDHIIEEHIKYLNRNFNIILKKTKTILYKQKKELEKILTKLRDICKTPSIIEDVFAYYEAFSEWDYCYKKERLLEYWQKRKEHPRYAYIIKQFRKELKESLMEKIEDIKSFNKELVIPPPFDPSSIPPIKITVVTAETFKGKKRKFKTDLTYELSKLHQKDHPFGINYFLHRFGDTPLVGDELRHMKTNLYNDTEYFVGYRYVEKLLKVVLSDTFYAS